MTDDEKLKKAFTALKKEDARKAPTFEAIVQRPKPRRSPWAIVVPIASAATAAAVVVVWWSAAQTASAPATAASPAVTDGEHELGAAAGAAPPDVERATAPAPLDFLLDLPGSSALAATTSFDAKVFR